MRSCSGPSCNCNMGKKNLFSLSKLCAPVSSVLTLTFSWNSLSFLISHHRKLYYWWRWRGVWFWRSRLRGGWRVGRSCCFRPSLERERSNLNWGKAISWVCTDRSGMSCAGSRSICKGWCIRLCLFYEKKMRAFALSKNSVSANLILDRLLLFNKRGNTWACGII